MVTDSWESVARILTRRLALEASRPVVGSSKKRMGGWVRSSVATETRRFSPPEIPRIRALPAGASRARLVGEGYRGWSFANKAT